MKQDLRRKMAARRNQLSQSEVKKKSEQIKKNLYQTKEFKQASSILFYVSYDNEVFTHDMIRESLLQEKKVVVPITDTVNRRLSLVRLSNWEDLDYGAYGILEPKQEKVEEVSIDTIDVVVVPGFGFDEHGNRIGHGMGYYDNLLKNSRNALHIALAFDMQIIEKISVEKHDIPVDMIVTEKRVITCLGGDV